MGQRSILRGTRPSVPPRLGSVNHHKECFRQLLHSWKGLHSGKCRVKADGTSLKHKGPVLFQVITNRSRTEGRLLSTKIPLPPHLVDQAPELTAELREYLRNRPEVAVGKEAPKVYLSSLGSGNGPTTPEITLTCHTNIMVSLVQLVKM
jgi:hypothetical protein